MGLFSKIFLGVDLDEEQRRQDEADAKLAALNVQALADGKIDRATFEETAQNIGNARINVEAQVAEAAKEGFQEGVDSVRGGIGSIVSLPFRLIPWQLWALAAVAAFVYLGGPALLKGAVARKAAR